ncbi:MAG: IS1182 family transposase [Thermoanaerobaculia bacterium]|nr:IS1182 family transposase [Thermoanaerobaculia bacterium]
MPTTFRPYDPDQSFLLPPSPRDWLSEDHLAYFISDTVDLLDLSGFFVRYEGDGRRNRPFHPEMMVKVLVYAYATGVFSSRKIAKKLEEDVAFRVLAAGNFPAHRTICDFRHDHLQEFGELFAQVVEMARESGIAKLGTVAVDGSKVKANASRHKAMSYGRMREEEKRLRREIDRLLGKAEAVDAEEDRLYGPDKRGDELPEELRRREDRLKVIREAKERLEKRQAQADRKRGRHEGDGRKSPRGGRNFARDFGVPENKDQDNFTDPESRIMKSSLGFDQCYNAQIAVDADHQIIVATGLTNNASDVRQLEPLVDTIESITGHRPGRLLADAGYRSEENLKLLEEREVDAYVALSREGKRTPSSPSDEPATERMRKKLNTEDGKRRYARRKTIPEPVFGWIKNVLGFRQFSFRGLAKTTGEWDLVCLATNLRRMAQLEAATA